MHTCTIFLVFYEGTCTHDMNRAPDEVFYKIIHDTTQTLSEHPPEEDENSYYQKLHVGIHFSYTLSYSLYSSCYSNFVRFHMPFPTFFLTFFGTKYNCFASASQKTRTFDR